MEITIPNYGTMPVEETLRSIFDHCVAGQLDIKGDYYCIYVDHKMHKRYALTAKDSLAYRNLGHPLQENETATFNGEKVRGMTVREEMLWNEDQLCEHVDQWGNIAVDEPFDMEWYMEHCL